MTFQDILAQARDWLQRDKRVTYRALQRHFALDEGTLADVKEALLFAHPMVDEDGRGLVWSGETASHAADPYHRTSAENRFQTVLRAVIALLQRERRVTCRTIKHVFGIDEPLLHEIQEELALRWLAVVEADKVLVWVGESSPAVAMPLSTPGRPATADSATMAPPRNSLLLSSATATDASVLEPAAETSSMAVPPDKPVGSSEPLPVAPEAERRQLTVMFCDLADSTRLAQQLDAEELREVIRAYQTTAATVIQPYDGHIAQYLGDGLLVYFGWPQAHEDDAQRAIHAALGIVEALAASLNPRLQQEHAVQLAVRLGVHTGPVVVGEMGGGGRHEHLATGDTVNIAARLEGLAAPNTVVLSQVTAHLVRGVFALEALGLQVLKGVTVPMQVFQVVGLRDHEVEDGHRDGGAFLVGRDEEVGLLRRRWEQAREGTGQVVLINGEAGIGKSSLVTALRQHVAQAGFTRLTLRSSPYHTQSPLYPVIVYLEAMLGLQRDDKPETKLDKLAQALRTSSLPMQEAVPLLGTLLSIPLSERHPLPPMSTQQRRQQTLDILVAWLMEASAQQPVLVVWEDLHWADPSTLEMLGLLLEQTPTVPMLHVLTYRPEFSPPWPLRSHMTPLTLNRLERPQVEGLLTHLVGGKELPTDVVQHVVAKTDGVPLYVEELTKMLLASGLLREDAGQCVLTRALRGVTIPDTLQDALMARLDQLGTAREVAQLGAVLGREFPYEMLAALAGQEEERLQGNLVQLVDAELLYQRGRPPRARYVFKHALIRDAAYASLLKSTRQRLHQQVVHLLETRFADVVATQPELLAQHCTAAGEDETAIRYWQQAGQRALERSAYAEAIAHLRKGIESLAALPDTPARVQMELTLQTTLGPALMAAGGYAAPEVAATYSRARELCHQVEETPKLFSVLWGMFMLYLGGAEHEMARELAEQCLSLAQRLDDPAFLLPAYCALGLSEFHLGQLSQAHEHLEQGVHLYDSPLHHDLGVRYVFNPVVGCLGYDALSLWLLGYPEQALQRANVALTLAQTLEHPYTLTRGGLYAMILIHQLRREWQMVSVYAETAIAVAAKNQVVIMLAEGPIMRGWAMAMQGQGAEGLRQLRQGLDAHRSTGSAFHQPYFLGMLAEVHSVMGQHEAGLTALREALALVESTGERYYEAELYRLNGELLLQQDASEMLAAQSCFQQALELARRQQTKSWELRAATSLARLWQAQGKRQEAYDLLAPVYSWFTEGFDTADLQEARTLLEDLA